MQYVPDLGRRAGCDEHFLFGVFKARDVGHRIVFEETSDFIQVHDACGRSLQASLQRHSGLIWLDIQLCRPSVTVMQAQVSSSKHLMHLRLGNLGNSAMYQLQPSARLDLKFHSDDMMPFCETSDICKSVVLDIPRSSDTPDPDICFHSVGADLNGLMNVLSLGGARCNIAAVDFKAGSSFMMYCVIKTRLRGSSGVS